MIRCRRRLLTALAIGCWIVASPARATSQAGVVTRDTAAARRIVDSLVHIGAWRLPAPDTVRLRPDTVRADAFSLDSALHLTAFLAGILVLAGLGWTTVLFAKRFFRALDGRSSIGMRGHWGGFGGNDGGWEASPALSLLGLTVAFAILTTVVASTLLSAAGSRDTRATGSAPAVTHDSSAATAAKK